MTAEVAGAIVAVLPTGMLVGSGGELSRGAAKTGLETDELTTSCSGVMACCTAGPANAFCGGGLLGFEQALM